MGGGGGGGVRALSSASPPPSGQPQWPPAFVPQVPQAEPQAAEPKHGSNRGPSQQARAENMRLANFKTTAHGAELGTIATVKKKILQKQDAMMAQFENKTESHFKDMQGMRAGITKKGPV